MESTALSLEIGTHADAVHSNYDFVARCCGSWPCRAAGESAPLAADQPAAFDCTRHCALCVWCAVCRVEERALQQTTGFTRYEDLSIEKTALNQTQDRILSHNNGSSHSSPHAQRISTSAATYTGHGAEHFTPKIFNQTGNHWHHDQGIVTGTAQRRDLQSHIQLGTDTGQWAARRLRSSGPTQC